jgi:hypothetical protein
MIFKRIAFGMLVAAVFFNLVWLAPDRSLWVTAICGICFLGLLALVAVLCFGAWIDSEDDATEDVEFETRCVYGELAAVCVGCGGVWTRPKASQSGYCPPCEVRVHGVGGNRTPQGSGDAPELSGSAGVS